MKKKEIWIKQVVGENKVEWNDTQDPYKYLTFQ